MGTRWTVGLYQGGASLLPLVWEQATIRFSVDPDQAHLASKFPRRPTALDWNDTPLRTPLSILQKFPVDALVLDHSRDYNIARTVKEEPVWCKWLGVSEHLSCLPRVVVQVWQTWASGSEQGPLGATQRKFMHRLGYETRYAILDAVEYGSPVQQSRLIVFSYSRGHYPALTGEPWMLPVSDNLPPRPMSNCLRPFGAGPTLEVPTGELPTTIPKSVSDPMPSRAGAWIQLPAGGYRRLFADELAKGLGIPHKWNPDKKYLSSHTLDHLPGSHVWETLGVSLESFLSQTAAPLRHATTLLTNDSPDEASKTKGSLKAPDVYRRNALSQDVSASSLSPVENSHCRAPDRLQSVRVEAASSRAPQTPIAHTTCAAQPPIEVANKFDKTSQVPVHTDGKRKLEPLLSPMQSSHCRASDTRQQAGEAATTRALWTPTPPPPREPPCTNNAATQGTTIPYSADVEPSTSTWEWVLPDLRPNHTWNKARIHNLKQAAKSYPPEDRTRIVLDGRNDLRRHRANYGETGAVYLQVLWWEFPKEHWESLRAGCSMNFLREPVCRISPNGEMDTDQTAIAVEFFEELVALGALEMAPTDDPIVSNAPLFCLPKPGQPGQWRVLANMKEGLQNEAIGNEPVYLPRVGTILPHMYTGGWSATVDASKFFYQFPTVVSERKFLGCVHPTTGAHYRYRGLPMGAGNSPAIAGRMGTTTLRRLAERRPDLFQGVPADNTWHASASGARRDHRCGKGRICVSEVDGSPVIQTWVHVDDFLLHGPTYAKTAAALSALMDLAVELGLLCNPGKTVPPTQRVKYCGFIYDTTGEPRLEIPQEKRSRALVQVQYTLSQSKREFSRLALSVVNGVLQSLVDATPTRLGQTFLRPLHDLISMGNTETDPRAKFYTTTTFTPASIAGLLWWKSFLSSGTSRPVRPHDTFTIGCAWGDGSGTGTGGTCEVLGTAADPMRMWMGTWEPHVHQFSSNWRELKTLDITLEQEVGWLQQTGKSRFENKTLLYFTDNMTTYHVTMSGSSSSPRLHALVQAIKTKELRLACHLEVVHVPGTTMIIQGTDGISRGVWLSPLHKRETSASLMCDLFAPVTFSPWLMEWTRTANAVFPDLHKDWTHWRWDQEWDARNLFGRFSVWTPPPEMASQNISFMLQAWIEQPSTTSAIFYLPRLLQREWRSLSRHLVELTPYTTTTSSPDRPTVHLLPVTVLYLPVYVPSLQSNLHRVDRLAVPKNAKWHRQQAELLRGLSADSGTKGIAPSVPFL